MSNEQFCSNCGTAMPGQSRFCPTCGAASAVDPPLADPTSLPGYPEVQAVELAGFWRRAGAYVIDFAIIWLAISALQFVVGIAQVAAYWAIPSSIGGIVNLLITLLSTLSFLAIFLGYYPYFWTTSGQTLGKKALGLRVVRTGGYKLGLGRAILRLVGYWLSGLALGLGFIWVAFDRGKQGWHDKIAGTQVVRVRGFGSPEPVLASSVPPSVGEQQTATAFSGIFSRFSIGLVAVALVALIIISWIIWMATGFYRIGPGEQAVPRLFGVVHDAVTEPGVQWWWPAPVGQTDKVVVTQTRRMELGFISGETGAWAPRGEEALMITGDLNIVDVQMVVQYNIKDLNAFLFNVDDPGEETRAIPAGRPDGRTLKDAAESALRLVVGQYSSDDVLVRNREGVEVATGLRLQEILDSYGTGIDVISVQLQDVGPPEEVRDAFDEVLRARQDWDTMINQARDYEADLIPRAMGDAHRIISAAEAAGAVGIIQAEEEAARFASILLEYDKEKNMTRRQLYLESMEEMLPGVTKFITSLEPIP